MYVEKNYQHNITLIHIIPNSSQVLRAVNLVLRIIIIKIILTMHQPTKKPFFSHHFVVRSVFQALRIRAKKQRAARKPHLSDLTTGGSIIENIAQTKILAETNMDGSSKSGSKIMPDEERPTNTGSGSNEEDDDNAG